MNKRHVLFLTAVLGMASPFALAQTTATSSVVAATKDPALSTAPVTVNTGIYRGPLSVLLSALAKSAGYDTVYDFNIDALPLVDGNAAAPTGTAPATGTTSTTSTNTTTTTTVATNLSYSSPTGRLDELGAKPIAYSVVNRPFNEVWPLLMDIYELRYEVIQLGSGQIIRISQRPGQASITLKNAKAAFVAARAKEFFGVPVYNKEGEPRGYEFESKTLKVIEDAASNRIVIRGTSEEIKKVLFFMQEIDRDTTSVQVQAIYTAIGKSEDLLAILTAQFKSLSVSRVPSTNQLVITGTQDEVNAANDLLAKIDKGATAAPEPQTQRVYRVLGNQADTQTFLTAQFPTLKVTPVGTSGQLVLNGPASAVTAALELLGQVDKAPANATVQKVFQLVNASAEEVKATLEGTLARDLASGNGTNLVPNATLINPLTGQPYTSGPAANLPVSAVTGTSSTASAAQSGTQAQATTASIIADKRTNTLIVRGTPEQVAQVTDLIPQLDQRVPQINVQVRIQEITKSAGRTLGLNWTANFGGFSVSSGSGGLGATFDPTRNLVGFNIFPTLKPLEGQGLTKSIYDGSITMQSGQRSLGSNTDTQNSSSTAAATIKSGGRLEINIPSQAANVPAIQKQIDYGVNLDFFSPQVAPDGTITLRVRGQINDLQTAVTAGLVPNLLQFTNSEAQTTLTFKNGETLLLSGLMKTKETNNNDGVPFLSSIPVVGALFGTQAQKKEETQLLVIITGTVVK